ncbi:MAG: DUF1365 domain-containing protein [Gammaproteobacteria bacterium]|nr:DUF1365 domain-containing protein [Gammaproteobacteria bacterium]
MHSCIYDGWVRHRRYGAVQNAFRYNIYMLYLDLAELDTVFHPYRLWSTRRPAPAWFRRRDHWGDPGEPLADSIRALVARETGRSCEGPIRLLTHLRYFGYCFNPVSFYYCFGTDERIEHVVMEVNNTPWGERHCYVLPGTAAGEAWLGAEFDKGFHVSPFLPMDMQYRARLTAPAGRLYVALENWRDGAKAFDAHLVLDRRAISAGALARHLICDPLVTLRVTALIHWQALRLLLRRAPFHPHPAS